MASLDILPDLVYDSKIETEFLDSCWRHIFYDTGSSAKQRRIPREERWIRREFVGRGTYGSVYLEQCDIGNSQKLRAVKEIKKSIRPGEKLDYIRELEAVAKFSHQKYSHCFVQSHGWFELGDSIFISMEYLSNGDLQRHLHAALKEPEARQITSQVLEGLTFMHDNGFVHRDLKPGNIMVVTTGPDWFVKITDFGVSKRRQHGMSSLHTQRGTVAFMAPEIFRSGGSYGSSVDMWSLGAVVYRIVTNKLAFSDYDGLFQFSHGMSSFPVHEFAKNGVSSEAEDFILALMKKDPNERLSVAEAALHPWMVENHQDTMTDDASQSSARSMSSTASIHTSHAQDSIASKDWSLSSGGLSTTRQDTLDVPVIGVTTKMTTTTVSANVDTNIIDTDTTMKTVAFESPRPLNYQKTPVHDVPKEVELRDGLPANAPLVLETRKINESLAHQLDPGVKFEAEKSHQAEFQNIVHPARTIRSPANLQRGGNDISFRKNAILTKESSGIDLSNSTDPTMTVVGDDINVKANNAISQVSKSTAGEDSRR
ncbi:hypothetical protein PFICI_07717 [Pestalotiopsis fici W106-1]|uniref:Autophagy-related protein 1 n=1 Tax=Pestalotiopsis fici (strain W106-1 / CGMCC3.15140) TaxID=1229662 RepID=W3X229_PESFW|nr:uncharacterized protein PFICI_07717 [Pestalotiopsis fici W106-1]ETS80188.1 hypothetical protein PFICI_07717 [Pestalotiopsis fici W106-1]